MENIRKQILERCLKQLAAIGAEYAVVIEGEKYGNLEIAKTENKPKRTRKRDRWASIAGYVKEQIQKMEIGDVVVFDTPEGENTASFQSHISHQAFNILGKGGEAYMTSKRKDNSGIELIRLQ